MEIEVQLQCPRPGEPQPRCGTFRAQKPVEGRAYPFPSLIYLTDIRRSRQEGKAMEPHRQPRVEQTVAPDDGTGGSELRCR